MVIVGFDAGFGDCKVSIGNEHGEIVKLFKFPSKVGITKKLESVDNDKIVDFEGNAFMVAEDAAHLPSENIISIDSYSKLEYYAPILLFHAMKLAKIESIDLLVTGLSIAQVQYSGHFQNRLADFTINDRQYTTKVYVLPQGAGAKLAVSKYGGNFPKEQKEFLDKSSYIIADIGFNTLDTLLVSNGKTDPNLFEGIEGEGLMKIASQVAKIVYENHNRKITLPEAKDILDSGVYKLRGQRHDYSEQIKDIKSEYLKGLLKLIDERYPSMIDKVDFIQLVGGGSTLFKNTENQFIRTTPEKPEFYNAIGEFLFGLGKI